MTPDLHPDELLDRDAQGELTDSERILLDAHLSQCKVCRFEREARLDFKDELMAGSPDVELLVAKVLAGGHITVRPPAPHDAIVPRRRRRAAPFLLGAVAAAMLFAAPVTLRIAPDPTTDGKYESSSPSSCSRIRLRPLRV